MLDSILERDPSSSFISFCFSSSLLFFVVIVVLFCLVKSDGQQISTIEWQELKNRFPSFFVHK